jgi:hypothetical protein
MSKSKKNNNSVDAITTEEVVDVEDTVESTETKTTEDLVATKETKTPVTTTEETATTESTTEKEDTSSKEVTPTESVVKTPVTETPAETEQPTTETVEEKKEETVEDKKDEVAAKEPVPEITLATVLRVRFCSLFSNKRLATRRNMPLYNIIYTHIHNRASYIGLCNGERYDDVVKYIQNNTITIESTKLSDKLKEQIIRKLKQDTDYAKIKWGNIDKQ